MAKAGWYPDPNGQAGWFRYWDGKTWSSETTRNPADAKPGKQKISTLTPKTSIASSTVAPTYSNTSGKKRFPVAGILVGTLVALLVIPLVVVLISPAFGKYLVAQPNEGAVPPTDVCPKPVLDNTPEPHPDDNRVYGGKISYPRLGSPWSSPTFDDRVPFGADVREQVVPIEPNYDKRGSSWVASILVGDLVAGDGFYTPEKGVEIVANCVLGTFYGDAQVHREDIKSQQLKVDGKDAYMLEMHLEFDIPKLKTKGETAIIVIVATGTSSASLYYASIPDTAPQYLEVARTLIGYLQVDD